MLDQAAAQVGIEYIDGLENGEDGEFDEDDDSQVEGEVEDSEPCCARAHAPIVVFVHLCASASLLTACCSLFP